MLALKKFNDAAGTWQPDEDIGQYVWEDKQSWRNACKNHPLV
jgi:hypothetical protein